MQLSQRSVIAGVLILLALVLGAWAWSERASAPTVAPETEQTPEAPTPESESTAPKAPRTAIVREANVSTASKSTEVQGTATLVVDGTRYALTAPKGATLKVAMDRLQSESDFSYAFREYAGLGAFVTHIKGRASSGEYVWILHINGEKSGTGISSTHIRSGDVIEWKLEESY